MFTIDGHHTDPDMFGVTVLANRTDAICSMELSNAGDSQIAFQ